MRLQNIELFLKIICMSKNFTIFANYFRNIINNLN